MKTLQDIFTKEYLMQLERLSFTLRQRMSVDGYSGARKSNAKGSSLEFSDFREYISGDDLRRVDWNGYARFGKLYVKLFLEEKQAEINIFLDGSLSMEQDGKFLQAKAIAASIAYIALCGGDRVNFFLWNEGISVEKRGIARRDSFLELLLLLERLEPAGKSNPVRAGLLCGRLGRGISVMISDFFTEGSPEETMRVLRGKKQEVIFVQMLSAAEVLPTAGGAVRLVDAETAEACDLELTADVLAAYEKALREHKAALGEMCSKYGAGFYSLTENSPLLAAIKQILQ